MTDNPENSLIVHVSFPKGGLLFDAVFVPLPDGQLRCVSASIDHDDETGKVTPAGFNAFRALCLADVAVQKALNLKPVDAQEELAALKANIRRLQAELEDLKKERPADP